MITAIAITAAITITFVYPIGFWIGFKEGRLISRRRHQHPLAAKYWDNHCED